MADEIKLLLSDPAVRPDDELIAKLTGSKKPLWDAVTDYCVERHGAAGEWNYYRDGGRWLFKMGRKKKTIFWAGITEGGFTVTFYFGDKAESCVLEAAISEFRKNEFMSSKRYGKIRGITFRMDMKEDIDDILRLSDLKVKL